MSRFRTFIALTLAVSLFSLLGQAITVGAAATATTTTLTATADSTVRADAPDSNYGTNKILLVGTNPARVTYLKFNLTNVAGTITSAKLRLNVSTGSTGTQVVKPVSDTTWGENAITWNNKPTAGAALAQMNGGATGSWVVADVTDYVAAQGNKVISLRVDWLGGSAIKFYSRETANPPQLVVTSSTVAPTSPPNPVAPTPTSQPTAVPPTPAPGPGPVTCNFTIGTSVATADGLGNYSAVKPGNTVCISAGSRGPLKLINFKGSATAPITFINKGGKVAIDASSGSIGIQVYGSQHIRLTGTGDTSVQYGIEIRNASNAGIDTNHVGAGGKMDGTEYIEIDHIYIQNMGGGIRTAKNNDLLDTGIVWSGHQYYIHDNYLQDSTNEGMYIGTSDTHGTFPIYDVRVYNNKLVNMGYDGIQIRQAHTTVLVHHNYIDGTGADPRKNGTIDNTAGFNIAKGTDTGQWFANTIKNARTGVYIKDAANIRFYNNLIIDSGHTTPWTGPEGAIQLINDNNVRVSNNTIVNPNVSALYGIAVGAGVTNSSVCDNIVGGKFTNLTSGAASFFNNNLTNTNLGFFGFLNAAGGNYRLTSGSPAVNKASSSTFPTNDFDGAPRPYNVISDIGSFEYHQ